MKKLLAIMSLFLFSAAVFASDAAWTDNFNDALAQASKDNKPVLADFTGSDWCPWCVKLDKEVFDTPEFQNYAKDNLILFKADFPRNKKVSNEVKDQNIRLMDKYGVMGFPTILILDQEGNIIATMGYEKGGPVPYVESIKKAIASYKKPEPKTDTERSIDELKEMTGKPDMKIHESDGPDTIGYFENMFKNQN